MWFDLFPELDPLRLSAKIVVNFYIDTHLVQSLNMYSLGEIALCPAPLFQAMVEESYSLLGAAVNTVVRRTIARSVFLCSRGFVSGVLGQPLFQLSVPSVLLLVDLLGALYRQLEQLEGHAHAPGQKTAFSESRSRPRVPDIVAHA